MTLSDHWEQFSAYRPMIEDARQRERERLLSYIDELEEIGEAILKREDCNADCQKCYISGHTQIRIAKELRKKIQDEVS